MADRRSRKRQETRDTRCASGDWRREMGDGSLTGHILKISVGALN